MAFTDPQSLQFRALLKDYILNDPDFQTALNGALVAGLGTILTTRGDFLRKGASDAERLALGAANSVLSSDGTDVKYQTVQTLIDSLLGSTRGSIPYRGSSTWAGLSPGTSGQFLKTQGVNADPVWADVVSTGRLIAGTPLVMNPVTTSTTTSPTAHGLGQIPDLVKFEMECLTADVTYSVGDVVEGGTTFQNVMIVKNATNLILVTQSLVAVSRQDTHSGAAITPGSWKITLTPYKLS